MQVKHNTSQTYLILSSEWYDKLKIIWLLGNLLLFETQ